MRTSGLVLDLYDDSRGDQLREFYPTQDALPEQVKTAHALSSEERHRLPDDTFALVLLNGEEKLRKYACIDEGNTLLSVQYFLKNAHKLPEEAQKVAALNLIEACDWYDLEVPAELEKAAGIGGAVLGLAGKGAQWAAQNPMKALSGAMTGMGVLTTGKSMLAGGKAALQAGPEVQSLGSMKALTGQQLAKTADVTGTNLQPISAPGGTPKPSKTPILKTARVGHLVRHGGTEQETALPGAAPLTHEKQKDAPQAKKLNPHVDVSSKEASAKTTVKQASRYALGDKYPLDSYEQVKRASAYFDEYGMRLPPEDRHEYCVNLVKRASELLIPVSEQVRKYGAEHFAAVDELKIAFDARRSLLQTEKQAMVLAGLEKIASDGVATEELVCEALSQFDKDTGLDQYYDRYLPDPFFSVYGEKYASEWGEIIGNDRVTEPALRRLAMTNGHDLKHVYGKDFIEEFRKDPVAIFKSLPIVQKKMLMRMATDNGSVENV